MNADWYDDPLGRHAKRWYDGQNWTANVLRTDGSPAHDSLATVPGSVPPAEPTLPPPPTDARSTATAPTSAAPTSGGHATALGVAAVGFLAITLSMFGLDWTDGTTYLDLADGADASGAPFLDTLAIWFLQWLGFALAAASLVTTILALRSRATSGGIHRAAALAAGLGALGGALTISRIFRDVPIDPALGAWLLPAGLLIVLAAVALDARRAV